MSPEDRESVILSTYEHNSRSDAKDSYDECFRQEVEDNLATHKGDFELTTEPSRADNEHCKLKELRTVMPILDDSAPGPDSMNYWILCNAPEALESARHLLASVRAFS